MFRNASLKVKLGFGLAFPVLMIAAITGLIFVFASNVQRYAERYSQGESASFILIAQQMKFDTIQIQQYLSDVSATRGQNGLDDGFEKAKECYASLKTGIAKFRSMYESERDREGMKLVDEIDSAAAAYFEVGNKMANAYVSGGPELGNTMMPEFDEASERITEKVSTLVQSQNKELGDSMRSIMGSITTLITTVVISGAVAVIVAIAFSWILIRSITKSVNHVVSGLLTGAEQTTAAAGQVAQSSQAMASGASEQASSIEQTSASLEQLTSMTKQNAENANQAKKLAGSANVSAEKGSESMDRMGRAIDDIKKSSDETAKIIRTIDEIAFQTNLLALNAAVEAARAGDAGKGFAVVAEEVRNLAQRSAVAAKSTASMIEGSVLSAEKGVKISHEVGGALKEITHSVYTVNNLVGEIASASGEQAKGIEQISTAMHQLNHVTQSNAASSEQAAAAAEELGAQADEMNRMVHELRAIVGTTKSNGNGHNGSARLLAAPQRPALEHKVSRRAS